MQEALVPGISSLGQLHNHSLTTLEKEISSFTYPSMYLFLYITIYVKERYVDEFIVSFMGSGQ